MLNKLGKHGDVGYLILRLAFGIIFLVHGWAKLADLSGTAGFFSGLGIPAAMFFAVVVALVEFLGGISAIVGFLTRWAGLLIAIDMLVAFFLVHISNGFYVNNGGFEFVLILFGAAVFLMFNGAGKLSLASKMSKR
ncbi:MAG: DoxX family protein [Candidatus Woesearchaeota archaeon]|nr:MAG: DoxX family protein [Candidatus Woesearchaeota archaeon]